MQFGGDEVVQAKAGSGSATLSMAYAGYLFTGACPFAMGWLWRALCKVCLLEMIAGGLRARIDALCGLARVDGTAEQHVRPSALAAHARWLVLSKLCKLLHSDRFGLFIDIQRVSSRL